MLLLFTCAELKCVSESVCVCFKPRTWKHIVLQKHKTKIKIKHTQALKAEKEAKITYHDGTASVRL